MHHLTISADGHELLPLLDDVGLIPPAGPSTTSPAAVGTRKLLGVTGAPGSGKSTFAQALARLTPLARVVPMDGFHLADVELARRGLLARKGAPETFDAWGYAALLGRLRLRPDHVVMAPEFDRVLEQPLAGAIPVAPDVEVVIAEGNYLLLEEAPWLEVRNCLDATWHVRVDDKLRRRRLIERHIRFGKSAQEAADWVDTVDEPNARLVEASAERADVVIDLTAWAGELLRR